MSELRETIARMVDPKAWAFYDRHADNPVMRAEREAEVKGSLFTAGELLALPQLASVGRDSSSQSHRVLASNGHTEAEPSAAESFWLILHEPGCVPQRKGPWPATVLRATIREFIAARPTAYIDLLTVVAGEPEVQSAVEALQMLDGRSMAVGRRHNERTRAAHADHHAALPNTPLSAGKEG